MNFTNTIIKLIFQATCFILAGYTTVLQFRDYVSNQDVSYVTYKRFNERPQDVYPTFTICLYSASGQLFKRDINFLGEIGKRNDYLYSDMLRGYSTITPNFTKVKFDEVTIDFVKDALLWFHTATKPGKIINLWNYKWNQSSEPSFLYKSYQDPFRLCFSKKIKYAENTILQHDILELNGTKIFETQIKIRFYFHLKGQLTRQLGKFTLEFGRNDFDENNLNYPINKIHITMNEVEILRKRPNAVIPCNGELHDDDRQYREAVIRIVGCIPSYWDTFEDNKKDSFRNLPKCKYKHQFSSIKEYFLPENNVENATKHYLQPCNHMSTEIAVAKYNVAKYGRQKNRLRIELHYNTEIYREYTNKVAYKLGDLWSRIGGLIGIFLGYSLLQVRSIS